MTSFVTYQKSDGLVVGSGTAGKNSAPVEDEIYGVLEVAELPPGPSKVVNGEVVPLDSGETEAALLAVSAKRALAHVLQRVAAARGQYITDLPGQDNIYRRKAEQAAAYLAATNPKIADFPAIQVEVGITAETPEQLAQLWLNLAALWEGIADSLEQARLTANAAISNANTRAEIDAAVSEFDAALSAILQG